MSESDSPLMRQMANDLSEIIEHFDDDDPDHLRRAVDEARATLERYRGLRAKPGPEHDRDLAIHGIETDEDVKQLAWRCGWDNRPFLSKANYRRWCDQMREFVRRVRTEGETIATDDDVERVAVACGWANRRHMTVNDYAIWCQRMRAFVALVDEAGTTEP